MHFQLGENYVDLYYIRDWKLNKAAGWNKGEGGVGGGGWKHESKWSYGRR